MNNKSEVKSNLKTMKMHFSDLFEIRDKSVIPKVPVEIGGVRLEKGKSCDDGVAYTGYDLIKHRHSSFDVIKKEGYYVLKTIYG